MSAQVDSRDSQRMNVEDVVREFSKRKSFLTSLCRETKELVEKLMNHAGIPFQSIQARVKDEQKLRTKYLDPSKNYKHLDDITDQVGLRVIVYYQDKIDLVADLIEKEFKIDQNKSVDKRLKDPDRFGYNAFHKICCYSDNRVAIAEYSRYADRWFEIQITSILGHAWAEMEHEWYDLRDAFRHDIKKRFGRLAAVLDLADFEFTNIRDERAKWVRSIDIQVESNVENVPIDAVSLRTFVQKDEKSKEVDQQITTSMSATFSEEVSDKLLVRTAQLLTAAGLRTLDDVKREISSKAQIVPQFVKKSFEIWGPEEPRAGARTVPGVSLWNLGLLLHSSEGESHFDEILKEFGYEVPPNHVSQVAALGARLVKPSN